MLVQDQIPTKGSASLPKSKVRNLPILHSNRFSESNTLDFSTWVSENLYKIVAILVLLATFAVLFFIRNFGNAAVCLENKYIENETINFKKIDWN